MGFSIKSTLGTLAALLLLASTASAQVPDPHARELAQQLAQAETILADQGYGRAAGPFAGGLNQRDSRRYNVTLRAGQVYQIVGVCDTRCRDIDLRVYDPNNAVIAQDLLDDRVPVVRVRPRATGQYAIELSMFACGAQPCWYAVNVYAR
ncbi:MAG TPA: hypothetical protein VM915_14195 [Verrucomicrobiae bacterium]|jgi:hypothetical protein|nr:hypothetical protein [Verrucomicrobiae bacterium]